MRAIVGSNLYCSLLTSKYPLACIVGKQRKDHTPRSLNYCCFANEWVLFFATPFLAHKDCANGPFEDCQVRMFVKQRALPSATMFLKQPNRRHQQLLAVENKKKLQQLKLSSFHTIFHLKLILYPHHTGMNSQMLYTNGSFEISQERMFVKQRRKDGWSMYLLPKKIFMLKQKSSNLYMIIFNSVKKFLSNYLCTLHWHAFTNALQKRVMWNLPRRNVCETASKKAAEAFTCCWKKYLCSSKNDQNTTW